MGGRGFPVFCAVDEQHGYQQVNGGTHRADLVNHKGIRHIVRHNVAWKNKAAGFYTNHSSGGNTWYNNTSYSNGTQYKIPASIRLLAAAPRQAKS